MAVEDERSPIKAYRVLMSLLEGFNHELDVKKPTCFI